MDPTKEKKRQYSLFFKKNFEQKFAGLLSPKIDAILYDWDMAPIQDASATWRFSLDPLEVGKPSKLYPTSYTLPTWKSPRFHHLLYDTTRVVRCSGIGHE